MPPRETGKNRGFERAAANLHPASTQSLGHLSNRYEVIVVPVLPLGASCSVYPRIKDGKPGLGALL